MAGASAQAPRIATRSALLTNAHPPAAAGAARIRIAVVGSQAQAERESPAGGVEAVARRVGAAPARARRLDRAPAVAGLVGLELEGHAARGQRAAGEAAAEAHAPARADVARDVDGDARLGVEGDVGLRGQPGIARIGAIG